LAIYTVHSRDLDAIADARFLRDGFSWGAFWLGPIWLLRHGLYASCAAWLGAVVVVIMAAGTILSPDAASGAFLAIQALLGLEADRLIQGKLDRQGYRLVDIVAAPNLDEAEVAFYRRHGTACAGALPDSEARP
jgi:hypothetical protein